jgi:uncharacterized membrane protein
VVQYFGFGAISWKTSLFYFLVGIVAAVIGQLCIGSLLIKYRKYHYFLLLLAIVTIGSGIALGISGIVDIVDSIKKGKSMGFAPLC